MKNISKNSNHYELKETLKNIINGENNIFEYLTDIPEILEKLRYQKFSWEDLLSWDKKDEKFRTTFKDFLEYLTDEEIKNVTDITIKKKFHNSCLQINVKTEESSRNLMMKIDKENMLMIIEEQTDKKIYKYPLEDDNGEKRLYIEEDKILKEPFYRIPIDLIQKNGEDDYTLFFIVSTEYISTTLEKRLRYYKYYFSRIMKYLEIILVIPNNFEEKIHDKFFIENCIGLWKLNNDGYEVIYQPKDLIEQIDEQLKSNKNQAESSLIFDGHFSDIIETIGGIRSEFGGHIDKNLMYKIFGLTNTNICYHESLCKLLNRQLTEKDDEYKFVKDTFDELWRKYLKIPYSDFLRFFEPGLGYIFSEKGRNYRDHYIHQFQVFLLGLPIIHQFYDIFNDNCQYPELCWLVASSYHDFAYPIQEYDEWARIFFNKAFNIDPEKVKNLAHLELKSHFIDEPFLASLLNIIISLSENNFNKEITSNWTEKDYRLIQFFYQKITGDEKNHGVLSAISLLRMLDKKGIRDKIEESPILKEIFIHGARAMTIHDDNILSELKKMRYIININFEDDPLSFLLIFCDNIQDWGRPKYSKKENLERISKDYLEEKKFYLKIYDCTESGLKVEINTPDSKKTDELFIKKQYELTNVCCMLRQLKLGKFCISLIDKDNEKIEFNIA